MILENFYFVSQIVASIAVIISLIYVGRQVNQNTSATQDAASQAYVAADNEIVGLINISDNLADILHRGARGLSALSGGELIQFMAFNEQAFISFQSFYLSWKNGNLDERLWNTYRQAALELLTQPGQQEFWSARRHWYFPEFRDYLENLAATEMAKPMHFSAVAE